MVALSAGTEPAVVEVGAVDTDAVGVVAAVVRVVVLADSFRVEPRWVWYTV